MRCSATLPAETGDRQIPGQLSIDDLEPESLAGLDENDGVSA